MKIKLLICVFGMVLCTALAKPQNFFPDDQDHDDNLKMESVSSTATLAFPKEEAQLDDESRRALDTIVTAAREGRQLSFGSESNDTRFDQLLSDPGVKEKLASASEVEARGFIHDKLCAIGLCDDGGFGGHGHGHGLGAAVKHVQLVQPVAIKPVGHPIPAIPLEKGKHLGHGHGLSGAYGRPPPPPPQFGHQGPGFGFGGSSGGLIPKPGGPQIFPGPNPAFGPGPAPFKPNYGPPLLPITKPLNTHVHHHIHHHEPAGLGLGAGVGGPYGLDGYYGAAGKSSVSVATPAGKALGTYPQAQTLTPSYTKTCICVPAEQCYDHGLESAGSQQVQQQGFGTGIPNNGLVGYGIDPRNLKTGSGIESNATETEPTSASEFPESPAAEQARKRRESGGFEGGLLKPEGDGESEPRQLNYNQNAPRNCQPGFVCCQNPIATPAASGSTTNNFVDYGNGRFQQPQQQFGQCGKRQTEGINGRVISGGNPSTFSVDGETSFGDYPWHVAILKGNGFVCSGSLIDSYHVLTAAHCIKRLSAHELKVRLGEWDVNHETEFYPFVETQVDSFVTHPDFYAGNLVNDVAILRLASSIDFPRHPHISPICLPPPNLDFAGRRCFVSGWGKDAFGSQGKFQNVLKEVDLPVLTHFDCEQKLKRTKLGRDFALDKGFVCAGGESNKDACKGDGGGGLVCDVQGTWYLAGIVSWGVGCGEVDVPGVYAKISEYTPWIQQNTGIAH